MRRELPAWTVPGPDGLADRRALAGPRRRRRRALAAAGPGRAHLGRAAASPWPGSARPCAPRRRWSSRSRPWWSTSSARRSRSTPTASTTCRRSCRRGTAWSTSRRTPSGTRRSSSGTGGRASPAVLAVGGAVGGVRRPGRPTGPTCSAPSGSPAWSLFMFFGPSQRGLRRAPSSRSAGSSSSAPTWAPGRGAPTTRPAGCRSATRRPAPRAATAGSTSPGCSPRRTCCALARRRRRSPSAREPRTAAADVR